MSRIRIMCVIPFLSMFFGTCRAEPPITLESLLKEMIDRDAVARLPSPAYTSREYTSYDRHSISPSQPGWFANKDYGNYLRTEKNEGRTEYVMMDADGPGAIVCFFKATTDPLATVRIYLDGSSTPVIAENLRYLLGGAEVTAHEKTISPPRAAPYAVDESTFLGGFGTIKPPLAGVTSLGCNLYLPIPFAKHCKVTYDKPGKCFYRIECRTYPPSTPVETFTVDALKTAAPLIDSVGKTLVTSEPLATGIQLNRGAMQELESGQSMSIRLNGPAAVRELAVKLSATDLPQALRSTVLRITFDGEQMVWSPVGDFFASGVGVHPYRDWANVVEADGTMRCFWTMPFLKSCQVELLNCGLQPVTATLGDIASTPWNWDSRSMYFHASWRQEYPIPTKAGDGTMDWNYVKIAGKGLYVGDSLTMHNNVNAWWGEGDEKIYVDDEAFPSYFGTGTEDYYGWSLGGPASIPFTAPFHSHQQIEGDKGVGYTAPTRVRSLDAIPFSSQLKFDMEIWHWKATTVAYAATTYWYALPGATCNLGPSEAEAARPLLPDNSLSKP